VESSLVGLPDFKSGVPSDEGGRWVRFPCTSAIYFHNKVIVLFYPFQIGSSKEDFYVGSIAIRGSVKKGYPLDQ
jgi:hypothetical protein